MFRSSVCCQRSQWPDTWWCSSTVRRPRQPATTPTQRLPRCAMRRASRASRQFAVAEEEDDDIERRRRCATGVDGDAAGEAEVEFAKAAPRRRKWSSRLTARLLRARLRQTNRKQSASRSSGFIHVSRSIRQEARASSSRAHRCGRACCSSQQSARAHAAPATCDPPLCLPSRCHTPASAATCSWCRWTGSGRTRSPPTVRRRCNG